MSNIREIKEDLQYQGVDETIVYTLTTTPWGSSPETVSAQIFEIEGSTFTDKTLTSMTGSASVIGDVITLPAIHSLVAETKYRVEIKFTCAGNNFEPYAIILAER